MRTIGKQAYTGSFNLGDAYRRILTCCCQGVGEGMLSTVHMPEMGPNQVLVRVINGYTSGDNVFLIESVEDIAAANEQCNGLADGSQYWFIVDRATVATDFQVAAA